jgi:hypothetical protein
MNGPRTIFLAFDIKPPGPEITGKKQVNQSIQRDTESQLSTASRIPFVRTPKRIRPNSTQAKDILSLVDTISGHTVREIPAVGSSFGEIRGRVHPQWLENKVVHICFEWDSGEQWRKIRKHGVHEVVVLPQFAKSGRGF